MTSRDGSAGSVALAPRRNGETGGGDALSSRGRTEQATPADVDAVMRALPTHGWRTGWTGRRDRALLVLSQVAGLSYQSISELTVDDISITDGVALVRTPGGTTTLRRTDDVALCGPCALARWIHALDLTTLYPSGQVAAAIIARAAPLTARSPHLCEGRFQVAEATRRMPVLPTTDAWGPHTVPADPVVPGSTGTAAATSMKTSTTKTDAKVETLLTRLTLRLSRYPTAAAPAANCDPSQNLEERARHLLGQMPK